MAWISLIAAGLFEMLGVMMMNQLHRDPRKWLFGALLAICFASSFFLLSVAMSSISMGTAYAIWTGIGAAGGALMGMILYGESANGKRIFFIALIIASVIGLKLTG